VGVAFVGHGVVLTICTIVSWFAGAVWFAADGEASSTVLAGVNLACVVASTLGLAAGSRVAGFAETESVAAADVAATVTIARFWGALIVGSTTLGLATTTCVSVLAETVLLAIHDLALSMTAATHCVAGWGLLSFSKNRKGQSQTTNKKHLHRNDLG